jgi:hypothetical protein
LRVALGAAYGAEASAAQSEQRLCLAVQVIKERGYFKAETLTKGNPRPVAKLYDRATAAFYGIALPQRRAKVELFIGVPLTNIDSALHVAHHSVSLRALANVIIIFLRKRRGRADNGRRSND